MIARPRGDHQELWPRRRYTPTRAVDVEDPAPVVEEDPYDEPPLDEHPDRQPPAGRPRAVGTGRLARLVVIAVICLRLARTLTRWLALLVVISVAYVAITGVVHELTPRPAALPATPRAWLSAYEAAAVDNPGEVCSQLLSPQLAATYGRRAHRSCRAWFGRITASSVAVRRVLVQGSTAVLELRQTLSHQNWSAVLNRRGGGWQAVDLLGS